MKTTFYVIIKNDESDLRESILDGAVFINDTAAFRELELFPADEYKVVKVEARIVEE